MDTVPAPIPPAAAAPVLLRCVDEEETPLGWECANPALQIEWWAADEAGGAAAGLVTGS